jgi:hypothetical protein
MSEVSMPDQPSPLVGDARPDSIALERLRALGRFVRKEALAVLKETHWPSYGVSELTKRTASWLERQQRLGWILLIGTQPSRHGGITTNVYVVLDRPIPPDRRRFRYLTPTPLPNEPPRGTEGESEFARWKVGKEQT